MNKEITICLTSCGRFDLLERTIYSMVKYWDGPKPDGENLSLILNEDSGLDIPHFISSYLDDWLGGSFSIINGQKNQIAAIDNLYSKVETPYIFHCEDDWEFYRHGFIQKSLSILEENPDIMQVWIREPNDRNGHPAFGPRRKTKDGVQYQLMQSKYRKVWNGFSLNPGLRRLSDYQKIGPYSDITTFDPKNPLKSEMEIGALYCKAGFKAATLLNGYVRHIGGNGRHVKG